MNMLTYCTMLPVFGAAALSDIKTGRIPNRLIDYGLLTFGILLPIRVLFADSTVPELPSLLLTAAICLGLLMFWSCRLLGGGDVKLFWLLFLYLPGIPGICCFILTFLIALPAALYGLGLGVRKVRLGGALLLAILICFGKEAGMP